MALVTAVVAGVWVYLSKLPQGRRMRAVMQHRDLAAVSGLPTRRVDATTFFLGSGLAGIAGVAVALVGAVGSQIGTGYVIDAFLVVIVGGLGKLRGAVIAAFALGLLNAYSEYATSASIGKAIVFACVVVFLQFRPNGLVTFRTRGLTA
jgi:urea transport system permease protein